MTSDAIELRVVDMLFGVPAAPKKRGALERLGNQIGRRAHGRIGDDTLVGAAIEFDVAERKILEFHVDLDDTDEPWLMCHLVVSPAGATQASPRRKRKKSAEAVLQMLSELVGNKVLTIDVRVSGRLRFAPWRPPFSTPIPLDGELLMPVGIEFERAGETRGLGPTSLRLRSGKPDGVDFWLQKRIREVWRAESWELELHKTAEQLHDLLNLVT